jgi:hypothetical protein
MDYYLGESNLDPSMHGELGKGGKGIILKGPFMGLQASSTFVTEETSPYLTSKFIRAD